MLKHMVQHNRNVSTIYIIDHHMEHHYMLNIDELESLVPQGMTTKKKKQCLDIKQHFDKCALLTCMLHILYLIGSPRHPFGE